MTTKTARAESLAKLEMFRRELRSMLTACDDLESLAKRGQDWGVTGSINAAFDLLIECQDAMRDTLS